MCWLTSCWPSWWLGRWGISVAHCGSGLGFCAGLLFFTKPFYTVTVNEPLHLVALLLYLLTAAW
ncbi:osmosensitive K+ channel histidine kinase KdpD [Cutibacterium acnes JCM 18909]|nr:osmosensitive K+ channel histidine kinase KdpD [Cutibacterium acnes JCM 18909]